MKIGLVITICTLIIVFLNRKKIKNFLDNEFSNIEGLNATDDETKSLVDYFSSYSTEELMRLMNNETLKENERKAISINLAKRQTPPFGG